jgi:hypothetical protein
LRANIRCGTGTEADVGEVTRLIPNKGYCNQ